MSKIDFVVTWVDSNDHKWRKEKAQYEKILNVDSEFNGKERYREWGLMKYWFRAVEKNAPWVNKIYFITEGHIPKWLNKDSEKLVLVKHSDYIDKKYLPTFNSNVIELNIQNIEELSENFVLFNDDMLLNAPTTEEDFFYNNLPKDMGVFNPVRAVPGGIAAILINNMEIINKYYDTHKIIRKSFKKYFSIKYKKHLIKNIVLLLWKSVLGFYDYHMPLSHKKSVFKLLYSKEEQSFLTTYNNKFRGKNEINHWLMQYWNLSNGNFVPREVEFGKYYLVTDIFEIKEEILGSKHKVICLNDTADVEDFDKTREALLAILDERYPEKSGFEI